MSELINNLDKLHTTEMGVQRIKKNLELKTDDVVACCKKAIEHADNIVRNGKNWYAYTSDAVITINAHCYTIITAHKQRGK